MIGEHEILKEIIDCLQKTHAISQKQLTLSQKADPQNDITKDFLMLVRQRDQLQERIENLILTLPGQRENLALKRTAPEGQRIYELAVTIEENDRQTRLFMEKYLGGLGHKLKNLRQNKQALKAYSPNQQPNAWFFDGKR